MQCLSCQTPSLSVIHPQCQPSSAPWELWGLLPGPFPFAGRSSHHPLHLLIPTRRSAYQKIAASRNPSLTNPPEHTFAFLFFNNTLVKCLCNEVFGVCLHGTVLEGSHSAGPLSPLNPQSLQQHPVIEMLKQDYWVSKLSYEDAYCNCW